MDHFQLDWLQIFDIPVLGAGESYACIRGNIGGAHHGSYPDIFRDSLDGNGIYLYGMTIATRFSGWQWEGVNRPPGFKKLFFSSIWGYERASWVKSILR